MEKPPKRSRGWCGRSQTRVLPGLADHSAQRRVPKDEMGVFGRFFGCKSLNGNQPALRKRRRSLFKEELDENQANGRCRRNAALLETFVEVSLRGKIEKIKRIAVEIPLPSFQDRSSYLACLIKTRQKPKWENPGKSVSVCSRTRSTPGLVPFVCFPFYLLQSLLCQSCGQS